MTKSIIEWENFILTLETKNEELSLDESEQETLLQQLRCALLGLGYHPGTIKIGESK